jgi:hypothetical protein
MTERKAISTRTRFEIFKRDGFVCMYCGDAPPKVVLHVDHIVAVANGGTNEPDNLVTSCSRCNMGKSDVPLTVAPASLAEKAADIAEREAQLRGYYEIIEAQRERIEAEIWLVVDALTGTHTETFGKADLHSIKTFLKKLPFPEVRDAAETACANVGHPHYRFKYFCGICWKKIKGE